MRCLLLAVAVLATLGEESLPARERLSVEGCNSGAYSKGCTDDEVKHAIKYIMTEMKRTSNQYRYIWLHEVHAVAAGKANFDGRNLFFDITFDMFKGQLSRHDVIVFKDEDGIITGIAIDEFPDVEFRNPHPDPDVDG